MNSDEIIGKLCECGFDTYIVGGAVRDLLRGVNPKDEDIVTAATPDQVLEIFKDQKTKEVGKSFKVVLIDGIEVATFRTDRYNGLNSKDVETSIVNSIEEDLSRRDFSINSMALCQYTGEVIDSFHGREDLKNKVIRFTGNPETRIYEDPNRILRACRFLASIGGTFEEKTKEALKKYSYLVKDNISKERISIEIFKALSIKNTSIFFRALHEIDALKYIFPSMNLCFGLDHGKFHIEDVGSHLMVCGDNISSKCSLIKLAGYLHDVGKLKFEVDSDNIIHFKQHEIYSYVFIRKELHDLKFPNRYIDYISNLSLLHMRVFESPKAIRRLLKDCEERNVGMKDIIRLRLADRKANMRRESFLVSDVKKMINDIENVKDERPPNKFRDLNINGNEIIELTGLKPGPEVGEILKHLLDLVIDDPELNENEILKQKTLEFKKGNL